MGHRRCAMVPLLDRLSQGLPLEEYNDVYCARAFTQAVLDGDIKADDTVLMLSIDGAQLYQHKQSDCWIYIWVLLDLAPDLRYKKKYVLPGGFIPGPSKPKNLDSFLFPGLHHLTALQREGLHIWDAALDHVFTSFPYFYIGMADGLGLSQLNGQVGHHGAFGCCLYCSLKGRHKDNGPHYYPVLLKPINYAVSGCDHADVDVYQLPGPSSNLYNENLHRLLHSHNDTHYKHKRRETGIYKPSIFSALSP
jgi:Transposase family tnp2